MKIAVPKETHPAERRVAVVPAVVPALTKLGAGVVVESGAGLEAGYADEAYRDKGASIAGDRADLLDGADAVFQVRTPDPSSAESGFFREGRVLLGSADPLGDPERVAAVARTGASLFAMELVPRITRAQSMDILSSQALVAGYKAVLLAAERLPRLFSMEMTAAGTLAPAHVFVVGAGVAGLKAIATAKRLGAVVHAYDVRPAVREQVESLGGKFVDLGLDAGEAEDKGGYAKALGEEFYRRQREVMSRVVAASQVVITTAAIPGKEAPVLVTADMVRAMAPASVIVDLAAERGGNCELTRADEVVVEAGVTILGPTDLPSQMSFHASQMYAKNLANFFALLAGDGGSLEIDTDDEVIGGTLATHGGDVVAPRVRELLSLPPLDGGGTEDDR